MPVTLAGPSTNHESDSEEDLDYIPDNEGHVSDSGSDERDTKRPRVESPPQSHEDLAAAKIERQALWAKFQDSVNASPEAPESEPKRTIKIEKRFRFAGEDVVEIVEVPEDSTEAKKWPLWRPPETHVQPVIKRPGRRKPKVQLAELPSSADLHKGKRLTTLEKSALDWKAHVTASGEPERGGGYLEKVEFLDRVGDRKNQTLEANKDQKRRRG
ncbi:hypothetical protein BGW80DRAFT_1302435 [Lactifluus volemus]|nr:hypothetical protein BGW80DRAFT_1302435 [Lactifluus volemus]